MAERDEFGAFLVGFIVGGLTGAVTALLMAPQSGEATRSIIRERAVEFGDKVTTSVDEAYSKAEAAAVEAQARFDDLAKMTRDRAEDLQKRGQVLLEEQRGKITEAIQPKKKGSEDKSA